MESEFRVGDFTVKPRTLIISKENIDVRIEPKMMDRLIYLSHHAGELVEKGH